MPLSTVSLKRCPVEWLRRRKKVGGLARMSKRFRTFAPTKMLEPMKVKVCGMRNGENIRQVAALGVDYIGMVFWNKSPRHVTMIPTHAGIIPDRVALHHSSSELQPAGSGTASRHPQRVGVFVDEMPQSIITRVVSYKLDVVQLHGQESPTLIRNLRATLDPDLRPSIQIWKAISISSADDIARYKDYEDCVDAFVFDTKSASVGGSGQQFDWSVLSAYDGNTPFLLSGGIGPDDAERVKASHYSKCAGIDLNSRFEQAPGLKDINKLKDFLNALNNEQD